MLRFFISVFVSSSILFFLRSEGSTSPNTSKRQHFVTCDCSLRLLRKTRGVTVWSNCGEKARRNDNISLHAIVTGWPVPAHAAYCSDQTGGQSRRMPLIAQRSGGRPRSFWAWPQFTCTFCKPLHAPAVPIMPLPCLFPLSFHFFHHPGHSVSLFPPSRTSSPAFLDSRLLGSAAGRGTRAAANMKGLTVR